MAKRKNPKGIRPLRKDERAYEKAIKTNILNPLLATTRDRLASVPQIKTAYANTVAAVFEEFDIDAESAVVVGGYIDGLRRSQKARMAIQFQAALGVDVGPALTDLAIRPLMDQAIATNINLIKSIPDNLKGQVLDQFDTLLAKAPFDQQAMVGALEDRFKVAGNRARTIARDQTGKIVGNLNEARQGQLGIKSYTWQTSEDERVVGTPGGEFPDGNDVHGNHFDRNGKEFLWSQPPFDGHPGEPINCRCIAIPVIPELQEEEQAA
ncbi:MAG: hypothetical protein KAR40_13825 [Candidatus Sabulitectum sp.]|nr:hypothetical protein [Candidatus Sabulitectum sp.]